MKHKEMKRESKHWAGWLHREANCDWAWNYADWLDHAADHIELLQKHCNKLRQQRDDARNDLTADSITIDVLKAQLQMKDLEDYRPPTFPGEPRKDLPKR